MWDSIVDSDDEDEVCGKLRPIDNTVSPRASDACALLNDPMLLECDDERYGLCLGPNQRLKLFALTPDL